MLLPQALLLFLGPIAPQPPSHQQQPIREAAYSGLILSSIAQLCPLSNTQQCVPTPALTRNHIADKGSPRKTHLSLLVWRCVTRTVCLDLSASVLQVPHVQQPDALKWLC